MADRSLPPALGPASVAADLARPVAEVQAVRRPLAARVPPQRARRAAPA